MLNKNVIILDYGNKMNSRTDLAIVICFSHACDSTPFQCSHLKLKTIATLKSAA